MTATAQGIARMAAEHAAAWTRGDAQATTDMYADVAQISVNGGPPHVGKTALRDNAQQLMDEFKPDLMVHVRETRLAQDRAVFVWVLEGTHKASGNYVVLPGWHEWDLDGAGKVAACRGSFDISDFDRQTAH